jgi:hypothetical protein
MSRDHGRGLLGQCAWVKDRDTEVVIREKHMYANDIWPCGDGLHRCSHINTADTRGMLEDNGVEFRIRKQVRRSHLPDSSMAIPISKRL